MKTQQVVFFIFATLPFLAIWIPNSFGAKANIFSFISVVSIVRIVALVVLAKLLGDSAGFTHLSGVLVNGYPMDFLLKIDISRICVLLTFEFCFLLSHWICRANGFNISTVNPLLFLAQGFCSILVVAENTVAAGGILILNAIVYFYLARFSMEPQKKDLGDKISRSIYLLFFLTGLLMIAWGITEFGDKELRFASGSGSVLGIFIWFIMLLMSVPLSLWARWFGVAIESLPEGIAIALVTFLSSVTLKMATIYSSAYPTLDDQFKKAFYVIGVLGSIFSVSEFFTAKSKKNIIGCFPGYFLSFVLVSVGVSQAAISNAVFYACMFVPMFTALALVASAVKIEKALQKTLVVGMFVLVFGFPGTPVYLLFSTIGARSIDMGVGYTIIFGILWFLYLCASVHICRLIFIKSEALQPVAFSKISETPTAITGFCLFLMMFIVLITHFIGGFL